MAEVWKVAAELRDGRWLSRKVYDMPFAVEYRLGERAVPTLPGSCLMSFECRREAIDYASRAATGCCYTHPNGALPGWYYGNVVLRCEAELFDGDVVVLTANLEAPCIPACWEYGRLQRQDEVENLPGKTVFCASITPLEPVKRVRHPRNWW